MTTYDTNNNKNQGQNMINLTSPPAQQHPSRSANAIATRHRTGFAGG